MAGRRIKPDESIGAACSRALVCILVVFSCLRADAAPTSDTSIYQGELELSTVIDRITFQGGIAALQPPVGPPSVLRTYAKGTYVLSMATLDSRRGDRWSAVRVDLDDLLISVDGETDSDMIQDVRTLGRALLFTRSGPDGQLREVRFPPEWSELRVNFVQHILSGLQFVPPTWASTRWATVERANGGDWRVQYTATDPLFVSGATIATLPGFSDAVANIFQQVGRRLTGIVHKTWHQRLDPGRWDSSEALVTEDRTRTGIMKIHLANGLPVRYEGRVTSTHENEVRELTKATVIFQARREGAASTVARERVIDLAEAKIGLAAAIAKWPARHVWSTYESPQDRAEVARLTLGEETEASINLILDRCAREPSYAESRVQSLPDQLGSLIVLVPAAAERLGQRLAMQKEANHLTYILAQGLAVSGTKHGQAALRAALARRLSDKEAAYVIIDRLAQARSPTEVTIDFLRDLADTKQDNDIREAAQLSFGTLVGRLKSKQPRMAEESGRWMVRALRTASSRGERLKVMRMIGNAGLESTWSELEPYFISGDLELAASALDATRAFPIEDADELFVAALRAQDWQIRMAAASGLAGRRIRPQSVAAELAALQVEPEESIRRVLIGSLWRSRKAESKVIDAVASIAKGDPSQDLRSRAELLLLAYAKEQMEAVNKSRLPEPAFR